MRLLWTEEQLWRYVCQVECYEKQVGTFLEVTPVNGSIYVEERLRVVKRQSSGSMTGYRVPRLRDFFPPGSRADNFRTMKLIWDPKQFYHIEGKISGLPKQDMKVQWGRILPFLEQQGALTDIDGITCDWIELQWSKGESAVSTSFGQNSKESSNNCGKMFLS